MLESLDLLSILATHQWNRQINMNFFFLGLHVIVYIHQIRVNDQIKSCLPNKINKICFSVSHQNNRSMNIAIILLDFIKILDDFHYNFFFKSLYYLGLKVFLYNRIFINFLHNLDLSSSFIIRSS